MSPAGTGGRLGFLDLVRGLAAVTVAAGHAADLLWPSFQRWSHDWFSPGRAGVCAFFLVSGYVIPVSLERSAEGTARAGALRAFTVSRLCRLYPMYWVSLAGALVLFMLGFEAVPADFVEALPGSAWANLTMAQELIGQPHAIGLYYTLTIELVWYAACALLFALGLLHRTELLTWAAISGLAVAGIGGPLLLDRHTPFSTGFYLVTMLVGTALARHDEGRLPMARVLVLVAAAAVVAVVGAWANYVRVPGAVDPEGALGMSSTLVPWAAAYATVLAAHAARRAAVPPVLTWLGLGSYSVYLLHPLVLAVALEASGSAWTRFGATLVATVALAGLTRRWVEAPGQDLGRRVRRRLALA